MEQEQYNFGVPERTQRGRQCRWCPKWVTATRALIACVLVIIISFIVIIALAARSPEVKTKRSATCGNGAQKIDPPVDHDYVNVFRDLDADEISAVVDYLVNQETLGITKDSSGNQILGAELYPPEKSATLAFLDSSQKRPPREALVTIAFTKETPPVVRQYVVGLLPDPNDPKINPRLPKDVLMKYFTNYKMKEASSVVDDQLQKTPGVKNLLKESFGATFTSNGCKEKCLITLPQKVSFALVNTTTLVFDTYYNVNEFPIIHALPFQLILQELDSGELSITSVFYAGTTFFSLAELVSKYKQGSIPKVSLKFPEDDAGSLNLRGEAFPKQAHAPPKQYEPQGPRYSIVDGHVRYLKWNFDMRMSVESGPQLWNVRWGADRLVYELSLQEVAVLYAGADPAAMFSYLSDSAFGLGDQARGLLPGVDCPDHANFLPLTIFDQGSEKNIKERPNALCVFEHNAGIPIRRHRMEESTERANGGLADNILIVRTIITEYNYDYIFDFVFHANGILEARVYATGYIMGQWYYSGEDPFGFKVFPNLIGSIHHHLFNFKVDMDIGGTSNRYDTLDFTVNDEEWPWLSVLKPSSNASSSEGKIQQLSFTRTPKRTEKEAVYHYNFDRPKYHIFYNDQKKNDFGTHRAYRLDAVGFSKQILPSGHPAVRSRKWVENQLAVTLRKENETRSSSIFSMYDGDDPTVDFGKYIDDNDAIEDEDLVTWVTLGMHHIPHTEDIPNTPVPGTQATIFLLPYNYFTEDPSMGSRDAVHATWSVVNGSRFQTYQTEIDFDCLPEVPGWLDVENAAQYP